MIAAVRRRGFTLLEIAILLAVIGLLSAALLAPFALEKNAVYDEEMQRMQNIRGAIFGYAARHRTPDNAGTPADLAVAEAGGRNARIFALPGGRPFLPCPDVTGDGYEDRMPHADPPSVVLSVTVSQNVVSITTTLMTLHRMAVGDDNSQHAIRNSRRCLAQRGVLPWRTLGVPPADHWGNLYAYFADDVFSDGAVGFNQNTASDIYDPRTIVTAQTAADPGATDPVTVGYLYAERDRPPLVICDGTTVCPPAMANLTLIAGKQAGAAYAALFREFAPMHIVEGVPFAVVSHGENGRGAAPYELNVSSRPPAVADSVLICAFPIYGDGMTALTNDPEAFNFPVVEPPMSSGCADATADGIATMNGFMIAGARRNGGFDDLVMWTNADDLLDAMHRGGALPADDFPALRPY